VKFDEAMAKVQTKDAVWPGGLSDAAKAPQAPEPFVPSGGTGNPSQPGQGQRPDPHTLAGQFNASGAVNVVEFFYPYGYLY
jgi:hypothetical protein